MDRVIRINVPKLLTIIVLSFAFTAKIGRTNFPWYFSFAVCVPLYVAIGYEYMNQPVDEMIKCSKLVLWMAIIPYICAISYSMLLRLHGKSMIDSGMRSISVTVQELATIFLAVLLIYRFQMEIMDILIDASILSYIYSLAIGIRSVGIEGLERYLQTVFRYETRLNSWFEIHDIGLSIGFFILYELLLTERKKISRLFVLILIFVFCYKRIAIIACFVAIFVWLITKNNNQMVKTAKINAIMMALFAFCLVYVMIISTGDLYKIAYKIGFDISNRKYLFSFVSRFYAWSLSFPGHGLGFTEKYLSSIRYTSLGLRIANMQHVHSDILKTYIDLGFWGSSIWFFWYVIIYPRILYNQKGGKTAHYVYCIATIYSYVVYATDNTSTYFMFQLILYSFVLSGCYKGMVLCDGDKVPANST